MKYLEQNKLTKSWEFRRRNNNERAQTTTRPADLLVSVTTPKYETLIRKFKGYNPGWNLSFVCPAETRLQQL